MKNKIDQLNKQQKAAVLHTEGPLAIIAGAGTGKTRTLTHKVAYLIKANNVDPSKILAVTFTNKATSEMLTRVKKLIGEDEKNAPIISTYHSFAAKFLRFEIGAIGWKKTFNIIDGDDQRRIIHTIYKELGIAKSLIKFKVAIAYISKSKNKFIVPSDAIKDASTDNEKLLSKIYDGYSKYLTTHMILDFDDLLLYTHKILLENEEIRKRWSDKFEYILVDEFQDSSRIQFEIINALVGENQNITIVGDPDQTIYTWRFADVSMITNFKRLFKRAAVIKLEENYRTPQNILDMANDLIVNNKKRLDKKLFSGRKDSGGVTYFHARHEVAEARWIVSKIRELKKERVQLMDIAILYRASYISSHIERIFTEAGINHIVYSGVGFFEREEIKDVTSMLKVIALGDSISFERFINKPARGIGEKALEKLREWAKFHGMELYECLIKKFKEAPIATKKKQALAKLINEIIKHKAVVGKYQFSKVLDSFLNKIDYYSLFKSQDDLERIDNIKEFFKSMDMWQLENPGGLIGEYANYISLFTDVDQLSVNNDFVRLMTVHAAKGLEFDNIFIAGFSDDIFPSRRALDEGGNDALEEERRLAYVAVTRAKKNLFISSSKGFAEDATKHKKPSRFLRELGIKASKHSDLYIAPENYEENYKEVTDISVGNKVTHAIFGVGTVVDIQGDLATIKFRKPHGEKTMMKNHKSIGRIG